MPYKNREIRQSIDSYLNVPFMADAGELSYILTQVIKKYLVTRLRRWEVYADVIKAIDSATDAYKEEVLLPYEKKKKKESGRVF